MKVRNLAVLATVAIGATALAAPAAFAADAQSSTSKAQQRTNADIKRLGENVRDLRKRDDETNDRISNIVSGLSPVLSQLGDAAKSYANFQYGFVQLGFPGWPKAVGGPNPQTYFTVTPRLDPTGAQATVTKSFLVPTSLAAAGYTGGGLELKVGVRSLNNPQELDNESTVFCNTIVTRTSAGGAVATGVRASSPNPDLPESARLPYYAVPRSPYRPLSPSENVSSLVGQIGTDKMLNFADSARSAGTLSTVSLGDVLSVSLSCMALPNADLKKADITPPFAN